jgi:uncharacterized protein (DUF2062 family)
MLFARGRRRDMGETVRAVLWPRSGWRRATRYLWHRLMRLSASPYAVAAGAAAGVFVSFSPLLGLHVLIAMAIAVVLRASVLAAALGTAVANPLTIPFMWGASYEVGTFVLSGFGDPISRADAAPVRDMAGRSLLSDGVEAVWPILEPMLVGSVPLGLVAAGAVYVLLYGAAGRIEARRRARRALRPATADGGGQR